jgi:hypothetical protein
MKSILSTVLTIGVLGLGLAAAKAQPFPVCPPFCPNVSACGTLPCGTMIKSLSNAIADHSGAVVALHGSVRLFDASTGISTPGAEISGILVDGRLSGSSVDRVIERWGCVREAAPVRGDLEGQPVDERSDSRRRRARGLLGVS